MVWCWWVMMGAVLGSMPIAANPLEVRLKAIEQRLEALEQKPESSLECVEGFEVKGPDNGWSPYSKCPKGFAAVGTAKLDLLGNHNKPMLHINDLRCHSHGCRVWCIGNPCMLKSRCCRVKE